MPVPYVSCATAFNNVSQPENLTTGMFHILIIWYTCTDAIHVYNLVAAPLPPPTYIDWSVDTVGNVTFKWTPVTSECFTSSYSILTSNCGSCPTTTAHTAVTCASLPSDGSLCTFAIQTVVCGNITGNTSDPVHLTIMGKSSLIVSSNNSVLSITVYR